MQHKGLIRLLAVLLFLVCAFYLSFTFVTSRYDKRAKEYAGGDALKEYYYLDSIGQEKVWFGYTLKECREKEINLGLDLKGGMNVTMEVSVPDIVRTLAANNQSNNFKAAMNEATAEMQKGKGDFVTLFISAYKEKSQDAPLAPIFATTSLKGKVSINDDDAKVEKVLREEVQGAIDNSFNVLRTRIDRFGVVQPNIQQLSGTGRILIELPGIKDAKRVRKLLQGSANLEFWETFENAEVYTMLQRINQEAAVANNSIEETADTLITEAADSTVASANDSLAQIEAQQAEMRRQNPLFSMLMPAVAGGQLAKGPVVGTAAARDTSAIMAMLRSNAAKQILPRELNFVWTVKALDDAGVYFQLVALKAMSNGRPSLEGDVITDAKADFSQTGNNAIVSMSMNSEGAKKWQQITAANIQRSVAIVLDGYAYSYPTVQTEIAGGNSQISGHFTVEEAKDLANTLKSGKMPAPARIIQEDVVGPSLGQESINAGLWSFALGFLLILIYMVFYYGWIPGLIADAALCLNVFFLVGILSSFQAVLTLPGIAGIVLTMGMAVDANVLIYERIREEMHSGKNMRKAIKDGFKGAISAIVDSNVTSFLTGVILAIFGTGPIKGFAVTYMIGIITSFLTAVFITRLLLDDYAKREGAKEVNFTTSLMKNFLQNTKVNFIGIRKITYTISLILVVIGLFGLEPHIFGKLNLGIDFSGGRNYTVRFEQPINTQEVEASLNNVFMQQIANGETFSVNVITIGADNQVRISTNYKINEISDSIDNQIETMLFEGCKPFLGDNISLDEFKSTELNENVGIMQSQKVEPAISSDITTAALWSVFIALIVIFLYILLRFRNLAFSIGAISALAHDSILILGAYAILWKVMPFSMEIDQAFIAAILTVIGYSINDTVVIFDRIREYNSLYAKRDFGQNINDAINATLSRTFSTSMSTFVVLLAIFIFGGDSIRGFVFALLMGIIFGTYSSIFIATPIAYDVKSAIDRRRAKKVGLQK